MANYKPQPPPARHPWRNQAGDTYQLRKAKKKYRSKRHRRNVIE
jgi:hypothetical protein